MKKSELYKNIVQITKKTGQGLSGIVKIKSQEIADSMDELIKEGLVVACDTGNTIGHPETNIFYMPSKGYNVWLDEGDDDVYYRYKGRFLQYVRLYVGTLSDEPSSKISLTPQDILRSSDYTDEYSKWLKRNEKELEIMMNLDEVYRGEDGYSFDNEEMDVIKKLGAYSKNMTVSESILKLEQINFTNKQLLILFDKTIDLMTQTKDPKLSDYIKDKEKTQFEYDTIKKVLKSIRTFDYKTKFQDTL